MRTNGRRPAVLAIPAVQPNPYIIFFRNLAGILHLSKPTRISPRNRLVSSYLYGFDEKVSPNNHLVSASIEPNETVSEMPENDPLVSASIESNETVSETPKKNQS